MSPDLEQQYGSLRAAWVHQQRGSWTPTWVQVGPTVWTVIRPSMETRTVNINIDTGCGRAMDPDMAVGHSPLPDDTIESWWQHRRLSMAPVVLGVSLRPQHGPRWWPRPARPHSLQWQQTPWISTRTIAMPHGPRQPLTTVWDWTSSGFR